ncbi:MAG: class I SAM-dependent methyltransferase [Kofleriaceae bacterium]
MRIAWVLLLAVGLSSCDRGSTPQPTPNGSGGSGGSASSADVSDREQTRFDQERRPEKVVEALGIGPGARVADIGAGSGLLTVHLARAVAPDGRVIATDTNGDVLDLLAQRMKAAGLSQVVERRVVEPDKPDLEEGAYDAILLAEVDHLIKDPAQWLSEAVPALKPGGRIVISNRVYHRANTMAAAKKAGLVLKSETNPVSSHFIAVFVAGDKK